MQLAFREEHTNNSRVLIKKLSVSVGSNIMPRYWSIESNSLSYTNLETDNISTISLKWLNYERINIYSNFIITIRTSKGNYNVNMPILECSYMDNYSEIHKKYINYN